MNKKNNMEEKEAETPDIASAIDSLSKPLPVIASAAAIASGYAYFLGTKYYDSFYSTLGAEWISRSVATTDRLLLAAAPFALLLFIASSAIDGYSKREISLSTLRKSIIISATISAIFYGLHFGTALLMEDYESYWWIGGSLFIFFSLSLSVPMSVINLSKKNSSPLNEFIYIFILIGLWIPSHAATEVGRISAENLIEAEFSKKPNAIFAEKENCGWKIIQTLEHSRVAIVHPEKKRFRIISTDEIISSQDDYEQSACK